MQCNFKREHNSGRAKKRKLKGFSERCQAPRRKADTFRSECLSQNTKQHHLRKANKAGNGVFLSSKITKKRATHILYPVQRREKVQIHRLRKIPLFLNFYQFSERRPDKAHIAGTLRERNYKEKYFGTKQPRSR